MMSSCGLRLSEFSVRRVDDGCKGRKVVILKKSEDESEVRIDISVYSRSLSIIALLVSLIWC